LFKVLFEIHNQLEDLTTKVEDIQTSLDSHEASVLARFDALDVNLQQKFDDLNTALDQHDSDVKDGLLQNYETTLEAIRVLHTPEGRRSSEVPACDGGPCDYPEK